MLSASACVAAVAYFLNPAPYGHGRGKRGRQCCLCPNCIEQDQQLPILIDGQEAQLAKTSTNERKISNLVGGIRSLFHLE